VAGVTDPDRWAYLAEGNAKQARKRVAVDVLVRDDAGRVLLVNPTYKEHWDLPGGMVEANEPPRAAAARELREELAANITVGRVLTLDWVAAHGPWDDQLVFVFDGDTFDQARVDALHVNDSELSGFAFVEPEQAADRLRTDIADRLRRALTALRDGTTDYDERP
jgi:ADP-ribose pyrophosphatase YjhB (NUDIX family)